MDSEDLQRIKSAVEVVFQNWEVVKSTSSINEIRTYQDATDEAMTAVDGWIEFCESRLNSCRTALGQAKLEKKRLQARQEQGKRLAISLYRSAKNV